MELLALWVDPPRLAQDLGPLLPHSLQRGVLYGYASFLTGWRRSSHLQFGFGLYNEHAGRLWRDWQRSSRARKKVSTRHAGW